MKEFTQADLNTEVRVRAGCSATAQPYVHSMGRVMMVLEGVQLVLVQLVAGNVYLNASDLERGRIVQVWEPSK